MEFVKLQCNICWSVAEIKNYFLNGPDCLNAIPIVELATCKHQLCSMCIRKIRKQKKVSCPICRKDNLYFNLYSVNRNVVDVIKCSVANISQWNKTEQTNDTDAASLAAVLFEKSLIDNDNDDDNNDDDNNNNELLNGNNIKTVQESNKKSVCAAETLLKCVQIKIFEQTKLNIKQKLIHEKLTDTNCVLQNKINKAKCEYDDLYRKVNELHLKRITLEKALRALNEEHAKIVNKNAKLTNQNKTLTNKNIDLIKHKNVLLNEYTTLKQKTYTCIVTNSTITTTTTTTID
ncbi:ORF-57 [Catopsilia pomona nucleopolyhedrovirus]|uniref:ORF-57 n=1 Tax=Catopsilia pomona nucleopolyhedrovirus TaxID=1850906 RepID=A0A172WZC8_9ABAC|nr:ORF-57 [Catopsilia pomona nucleopolyhedrovirus]ANF29705.1 ORF-57 [Catopsilia pomona nucleopolyhedrovirus]